MTKHINPGTDTTINPVVIDDSYRERKHKGQPRVDWVEEVRLRCYSYTEFYGGERAIRFDELEGVIQQVKEERKECHDAHTPTHHPTATIIPEGTRANPCKQPTEAQQRIDAAIKELKKRKEWLHMRGLKCKNGRSIAWEWSAGECDRAIALLQAGDHHE